MGIYITPHQGSKPYPLPSIYRTMWRHAVCLRKTLTDSLNPPTGHRPRFTSAMGAIWDSYPLTAAQLHKAPRPFTLSPSPSTSARATPSLCEASTCWPTWVPPEVGDWPLSVKVPLDGAERTPSPNVEVKTVAAIRSATSLRISRSCRLPACRVLDALSRHPTFGLSVFSASPLLRIQRSAVPLLCVG